MTSTALLVRPFAGSKLFGFAGSSIVIDVGMVVLLDAVEVELLVDEVGGVETEDVDEEVADEVEVDDVVTEVVDLV